MKTWKQLTAIARKYNLHIKRAGMDPNGAPTRNTVTIRTDGFGTALVTIESMLSLSQRPMVSDRFQRAAVEAALTQLRKWKS